MTGCAGFAVGGLEHWAALHHFVEAAGMVAGLRFAGSALVRRTIFVTSGKWFCGARPA